MKRKIYFLATVVAVASFLFGCNTATNTNTNTNTNMATPAAQATVTPEMTRREYTEKLAKEARERAKAAGETIGETLDDAWIHTKIVAKLIANTTTPERRINVDVVNNIVTLRGTVDTTEARAEAERIAKETEGVKQVKNQLKVGAAAKATPKR